MHLLFHERGSLQSDSYIVLWELLVLTSCEVSDV